MPKAPEITLEDDALEAAARAVVIAGSISVHGGRPEDWSAAADNEWLDYLPEAEAAIRAYLAHRSRQQEGAK